MDQRSSSLQPSSPVPLLHVHVQVDSPPSTVLRRRSFDSSSVSTAVDAGRHRRSSGKADIYITSASIGDNGSETPRDLTNYASSDFNVSPPSRIKALYATPLSSSSGFSTPIGQVNGNGDSNNVHSLETSTIAARGSVKFPVVSPITLLTMPGISINAQPSSPSSLFGVQSHHSLSSPRSSATTSLLLPTNTLTSAETLIHSHHRYPSGSLSASTTPTPRNTLSSDSKLQKTPTRSSFSTASDFSAVSGREPLYELTIGLKLNGESNIVLPTSVIERISPTEQKSRKPVTFANISLPPLLPLTTSVNNTLGMNNENTTMASSSLSIKPTSLPQSSPPKTLSTASPPIRTSSQPSTNLAQPSYVLKFKGAHTDYFKTYMAAFNTSLWHVQPPRVQTLAMSNHKRKKSLGTGSLQVPGKSVDGVLSSSPSNISASSTGANRRKRSIDNKTNSQTPLRDLSNITSMEGIKSAERSVSVGSGLSPSPMLTPKIQRTRLSGLPKRLIRPIQDNPLVKQTVYLLETYSRCNAQFRYDGKRQNPRRVLTKLSKGVKNDGYDNEDNDFILYVNDILGDDEGKRYLIIDILGQGTFGQVVKCRNLKTRDIVAVKVVKNKPAYFNQSMMEVTILELLNNRHDRFDCYHITRMHDTFIFRKHLCLVFELLSINLYELIKQNQFRGLNANLVKVFTAQILDTLCVLNEAKLIHCDLKPENILLKDLQDTILKVIDFGSACHEQQTVYTYIQSRFYRSPEVLLGLPYSSSIDMWSLGCIVAELFLGLPLFPGTSEYNQISRIVEIMGLPPAYMIEVGKSSTHFFNKKAANANQKAVYTLKDIEQYMRERSCVEQPSKKYFSGNRLHDIIMQYPINKKLSKSEVETEMQNRRTLSDFIAGLLNLNPIERWSPHQAKQHPFITGQPFTGPYIPSNKNPRVNTASLSLLPPSSNSTDKLSASTSNASTHRSTLISSTAVPGGLILPMSEISTNKDMTSTQARRARANTFSASTKSIGTIFQSPSNTMPLSTNGSATQINKSKDMSQLNKGCEDHALAASQPEAVLHRITNEINPNSTATANNGQSSAARTSQQALQVYENNDTLPISRAPQVQTQSSGGVNMFNKSSGNKSAAINSSQYYSSREPAQPGQSESLLSNLSPALSTVDKPFGNAVNLPTDSDAISNTTSVPTLTTRDPSSIDKTRIRKTSIADLTASAYNRQLAAAAALALQSADSTDSAGLRSPGQPRSARRSLVNVERHELGLSVNSFASQPASPFMSATPTWNNYMSYPASPVGPELSVVSSQPMRSPRSNMPLATTIDIGTPPRTSSQHTLPHLNTTGFSSASAKKTTSPLMGSLGGNGAWSTSSYFPPQSAGYMQDSFPTNTPTIAPHIPLRKARSQSISIPGLFGMPNYTSHLSSLYSQQHQQQASASHAGGMSGVNNPLDDHPTWKLTNRSMPENWNVYSDEELGIDFDDLEVDDEEELMLKDVEEGFGPNYHISSRRNSAIEDYNITAGGSTNLQRRRSSLSVDNLPGHLNLYTAAVSANRVGGEEQKLERRDSRSRRASIRSSPASPLIPGKSLPNITTNSLPGYFPGGSNSHNNNGLSISSDFLAAVNDHTDAGYGRPFDNFQTTMTTTSSPGNDAGNSVGSQEDGLPLHYNRRASLNPPVKQSTFSSGLFPPPMSTSDVADTGNRNNTQPKPMLSNNSTRSNAIPLSHSWNPAGRFFPVNHSPLRLHTANTTNSNTYTNVSHSAGHEMHSVGTFSGFGVASAPSSPYMPSSYMSDWSNGAEMDNTASRTPNSLGEAHNPSTTDAPMTPTRSKFLFLNQQQYPNQRPPASMFSSMPNLSLPMHPSVFDNALSPSAATALGLGLLPSKQTIPLDTIQEQQQLPHSRRQSRVYHPSSTLNDDSNNSVSGQGQCKPEQTPGGWNSSVSQDDTTVSEEVIGDEEDLLSLLERRDMTHAQRRRSLWSGSPSTQSFEEGKDANGGLL